MPNFTFVARDPSGGAQQGVLDAPSPDVVVNDLRGRGWLVLDVRADDEPASRSSGLTAALNPLEWLPARQVDVEISLRQIAVMLRAGLTLLAALRTVAEQAGRPAMRRIWEDCARQIQEGSNLANAMAQHSRFSALVVQLIRVGEQTGTLEPVLNRAARTLESRRLLRNQMLTAMTYPTIVLVAAIGVTGFMVFSVLPKLETFLSTVGRRLPRMTQLLVDISHFMRAYIVHASIGMALLAAILFAVYSWPPGRMVIDRLILRIPVFGTLLRLSGTVLFARGLGTLLRSGIMLLEGLQTVERLIGNRYLATQVAAARDSIMQGGGLAEPLATKHAFMPMLSRMTAVGESSGDLDEILDEVSRFYEDQLQRTIRWLSVVIEPAIIVVVGGIVGFVYIAFFMALFAAGGAGQ